MEEITFSEALVRAREITSDGADPDKRDAFDIYLDLARIIAKANLEPFLDDVPISDVHRWQLIETEAYSVAQPAHLADGTHSPTRLLDLIAELDFINFQ